MNDDKAIDRGQQKSPEPTVTPRKVLLKTVPVKAVSAKPITAAAVKPSPLPSSPVNAKVEYSMPHPGQQLKAAPNTYTEKKDSSSAKPDAELSDSKNDEAKKQNVLLNTFGSSPQMGILKSRDVCILLSLIPIVGIPRMYLGYWKHAIIQFLLCFLLPISTIIYVLHSLMTTYEGSEEAPIFLLYALALSATLFVGGWLWCYIESHIIKTDARGQSVMPGSFWRRVKYAALGYLGLLAISFIVAVCLIPYMDVNNGVGTISSHSVLQSISIGILILFIFTMVIFGSIGIYKAKNNSFYLHGSVPDLLLSSFLTALFWLGFIAPIALDKSLVEKGNELSIIVTFFLGTALCILSIWLTIRQIKKCNKPLTKWELFIAICGRLLIVTGIQILCVAVVAALARLVRERNEVGGRAKVHPVSFADENQKIMNTWGEIGKKLKPFILAVSLCIVIGKILYKKILDTCEDDEIDLPPSAYGVANLFMIVLAVICYVSINGCIHDYLPAVPHTARTAATAPIEQPSNAITELPEPEDGNSYDFTPDEEVVKPISTPQQEEPTATPTPEPVEVHNPMHDHSAEPEQRATADTGEAPRDPQAYVPTGDTTAEQAIAAVAYSLSPEHFIEAELLPLKNGAFFKREGQNGDQITVSAWVKLRFVDKEPSFRQLMENIKPLFAEGSAVEEKFLRTVDPVADDAGEESMCRDAGDFDPAQNPAVTYIATDTLLENISADTNLLLLSVGETIYGFSLSDEKSQSYVLYDMIKRICGKNGIFPLRTLVQLKDKDNQVLAQISREDPAGENCGQPMYSLIYSNVAEKEALMIDPSFYGGSAVVYAEPGGLYFRERIVKVTGVISSQAEKQVAYVSTSVEAPSFKLSKEDIRDYAARMEQAEKYDNEKKAASLAAAASPEPQPAAPIVQAPESLVGKRIRFIYTDTRFRSGEEGDDGECVWENWQTQDLSQADLWVGQVAPSELNFASSDKAIVKPAVNDGSYLLIGTYAPGVGSSATVHRQLAFTPDELADESGEYILSFDSPTGGTAALRNCGSGEMHFECENIQFVVEEMSEEEIAAAGAETSGGLSEAEKAELQDFLESLIMVSSRSSSTTKLYQGRLLMLLPMIQEGSPVDVTTAETKGNTALHYACGMGRVDIVEWLVNHGADVNKQTDKGATPLDCVSGGYNATEIRRILTQHGATKGKKGRR